MENQENNGQNLILLVGKLDGKLDMVVSSMTALAASFENLEKGRLSKLEIAFASSIGEAQANAKTTAIWVSVLVSLGVMIAGAFIIKHFGL